VAVETYAKIYSCHSHLIPLRLCSSTTSTAVTNPNYTTGSISFKRYSTDTCFLCQMVTQAIVIPLTASYGPILHPSITV